MDLPRIDADENLGLKTFLPYPRSSAVTGLRSIIDGTTLTPEPLAASPGQIFQEVRKRKTSMNLPVFGTQIEGHAYVRRPSAYALVQNGAGEWALVRTPQGYFLPGGGMEPGETPQQTVVRESREECGFVLNPGRVIGRAIQFVYSTEEKEYFEKICEFVEAELIGRVAQVEDDHELIWLPLDEALESLSHESHRWAVACVGGPVSGINC